jgi:hypothetical protein
VPSGEFDAMSPLAIVLVSVAAVAALVLAVSVVRSNIQWRYITRCVATAAPEQLERIYALIEATGTADSDGYFLGRTSETCAENRCVIPIPLEIANFPWAGLTVEATVPDEVRFQFVEGGVAHPSVAGQRFRPVRVPRHRSKKSGKWRNTFSPKRYIADSSELDETLRVVCPKFPIELLSYLVCGSLGFESIDQLRIGTNAAWVQGPEEPTCGECKKRMRLILQLPGALLSDKSYPREGTFYFFGCVRHPTQTSTVGQLS